MCQIGERCPLVTPLYSQFLVLNYPANFMQVHEDAVAKTYIQEHVLAGETVHDWSQMLTIRADQDLALNLGVTPEKIALSVAEAMYASCPDTFSGLDLGGVEIDGREAYLNVVGCGTVSKAKPYSEVTLFVVIKGAREYYVLQWAERGEASSSRPTYDSEKWVDRFAALNPVKICDSMPDKQEPVLECLTGL